MKIRKVSIIGMGYVGLPLAIECGKRYLTVGFDIDKKKIENLNNFIDHTNEIKFTDFKKSKKLTFSSNQKDLNNSTLFIVAVPTPINSKYEPDLSLVKKATKYISKYAKGSIIIYESTVYPGVTEDVCVPIIEKNSKLKHLIDFNVAYSPERINPGDKIHTLTKIKKIVSADNEKAITVVNKFYKSIIKAGTYKAKSIKIAEAAKVIENAQRDINIAFMNELSIIFDKLNLNTSEILDAASTKWNFLKFSPGLVGGHCIGIDPYYISYISKSKGYTTKIINHGRKINNSMPSYIFKKFITVSKKMKLNNNIKILFLGLTFKENCNDFRNSKAIELFLLFKKFYRNSYFNDPYFMKSKNNHSSILKESYLEAKDIKKTSFDSIILTVPHKTYLENFANLFDTSNLKILFDLKSEVKNYYIDSDKIIYWSL